MAEEDVAAVLKKAASDDVFRVELANDFDGTIGAHNLNLSDEEKTALRNVSWNTPLPSAESGSWVHIYSREEIE